MIDMILVASKRDWRMFCLQSLDFVCQLLGQIPSQTLIQGQNLNLNLSLNCRPYMTASLDVDCRSTT